MDFGWVKNIFKRESPAEDAVEEAVMDQLRFEVEHPIPFDADQRRLRVIQAVRRKLSRDVASDERLAALVELALAAAAQHKLEEQLQR